jgi:hypothetical protein
VIRNLTRPAVLLGSAIAAGVFATGTAATLFLITDGSGGTLDGYKVAGTWIILGAIAGRAAFNIMTPKPSIASPE